MDAAYLNTRIKHIADADLFASLNLDLPGLEGVRSAAREERYLHACEAWRAYLLGRPMRRSLPEEAYRRGDIDWDDVISEADRVVARDIRCWSDVRVQYPGEIDFSRDAGQPYIYGFNYFGWIVPLALAYRQTGREKYARAFVEIFTQWYRQRDLVKGHLPQFDGLWYELGVGNRPPIFTDLYFATLQSEAAHPPEFHLTFLKTILGHGRWLHRHETAYRRGNWQVCGAKGLLFTGLAFPEFREARAWVRCGLRWLLAHVRRDVYSDGCHRERAPHYHLGVVQDFFEVYRGLRGSKGPQRREIGRAVHRMLSWTVSVMTPSGHSPAVGDSEYDVPQDRFLKAGLVLGSPEILWASKASARQIQKIRKGMGVQRTVFPMEPMNPDFHHPASRFLILRSGWKRDDLYFSLNYGPWAGGHSHAEALAFQLWARGNPLAVDCGRGISYDDPLHKPWFVTPHAHNMVVVDGEPPSLTGRQGRLLFWRRGEDFDFLGLTHAGYAEKGVRHRRCFIVNRSPGYLVVLDFLTSGTEDHLYEWVLNSPLSNFRTGPGIASSPSLSVCAAQPERVEETRIAPVRMCLPLQGRSTWGVARPEGTHLRFVRRGGSLEFLVLAMPSRGTGGVGFTAMQTDPRSRYRLRIAVSRGGTRQVYAVDCMKGICTKV